MLGPQLHEIMYSLVILYSRTFTLECIYVVISSYMYYRPATIFLPYLPFFSLLVGEIKRFFSMTIESIFTPAVTASLYLLIFGISLGSRISVMEGFTFIQFVVPGLVLMGGIDNSFANACYSLFIRRYLGYIADLLCAPISPLGLVLAFVIASVLRGFLVGGVVLCVSLLFTTIPFTDPWAALALFLLTCIIFAQFGLIVAIFSNKFETLSMYTSFLILPLIYMGGLFYPISILPEFWAKVSLFNPIYYLMDGFRHAILGVGEMSLWVSFAVAGALAIITCVISSWMLYTGYRIRN